jgi:hypothetical protein
MANDSLTLILNGEVTLADFAAAMARFTDLVADLSNEVAGEAAIQWMVEHLDAGSATATVRAVADDRPAIERVVEAYGIVARAAETGDPIPYSGNILARLRELAEITDGRITSVSLATDTVEATIARGVVAGERPHKARQSYGMVKGRVESITRRRGLKFTLYDEVFDRPIICHIREDQKELMRNAWGRRATVAGRIARDPVYGHPVWVRDITEIRLLNEYAPGAFRKTLGILPLKADAENSEDIIRRLRNAP